MLTNAQNTQTTPNYYEPDSTSDDPDQHKLRVLIDEAATLRGLTIQMALRLMALAAAPGDADRRVVLDEFRTLRAQFKANMAILFGTSPAKGENKDHVEWIRRIVATNPDRRAALLKVETNIQRIEAGLDAGQMPSFENARAFFDENWPVVRDKITEVIWDLWADLDANKSAAEHKNAALQSTLQETLTDIKGFSSAIRMIAINTAVMASRPQDEAAGFQAIAKEVKRLSEDIQQSTNRAKETITSLL